MKILCITPIKHLDGIYEHLCSFGPVTYLPNLNKAQIQKLELSNYNVIFCNPNKQNFLLDSETLKNFKGAILTASTGLNHIDCNFCDKNNIKIPKSVEPETLTKDQCVELIEKQKKSKKGKRRPAKKKK